MVKGPCTFDSGRISYLLLFERTDETMVEGKVSDWKPICVASTEDSDGDDRKSGVDPGISAKSQDYPSFNYFKGAEWFVQ